MNTFAQSSFIFHFILIRMWALILYQTFYFIMFLSTAGTSKLHKPRELWHSGWWSAKIILWVALMMLPFLVPSAFIQLYG